MVSGVTAKRCRRTRALSAFWVPRTLCHKNGGGRAFVALSRVTRIRLPSLDGAACPQYGCAWLRLIPRVNGATSN